MPHTLVALLIVLVAAKVAAEASERIGLPAVVGEILAGVVVGPSVLAWVHPDEVLHTLGELGVILLLLQVGLELDLADLGAVGRASMAVAVAGIVVPFAAGYGVMSAFGEGGNTAIFVGAALTATSVGITARVFGDLRALASREARTVLGAAVADDVLGLVILTVVVRLVAEGSVSFAAVLGLIGVAVGFLVVTAGIGVRLAPWLFRWVHRLSRSTGTMVVLALSFTLVVAQLASLAKLAPIVGAFVAGLALTRSDHAEHIRRDLSPIAHLFVPVFFLQIGIDADVSAFARPRVLGLAACLFAVGVAGKVLSAWAAPRSVGDRLLIGVGMVPRGEVGLIFAGIGLREGVLGEDLYGALLLVVLATTLLTPPVLGARLRHLQPPSADETVPLSAVFAAAVVPEPMAVDGPVWWDAAAPKAFCDLLRHGNPRSWRYLEATGVLERAAPEVAAAMARRRADPFDLDPIGWPLVDALGDADDRLLVAALCIEADAPELARRFEVDELVDEAGLLRAAALRPDAFDEHRVVQLAAHLRTPQRADDLYALGVALGGPDPRLDALHDLVRSAPVAERPSSDDPVVADRLAHAAPAYVLTQSPEALVRQAALASPRPGRREVRVNVVDDVVEVVCRDRRGLLAIVTGALDVDVLDAVATTWPDSTALQVFRVRTPPDADELRRRIEAGSINPEPVGEAAVSFDDEASPWYTLCQVEAPDRPGLLHALAALFAEAGVDVHSARVSTVGDVAVDRFELTDGSGRKLDAAAQAEVAGKTARKTARFLRNFEGIR